VLGGWILKMVLFIAIVAALRGANFIDGPVFFFTLVASILGTLVIDSLIVMKSRITVGSN
jgi:4-amino-4-deoxy-L-arabinose transferase-like glycosyltransferase